MKDDNLKSSKGDNASPFKTLFLDFDGTIHDSIHVYYPAFLKGYQHLVDHGVAPLRTFTSEEVQTWLGYNSVEMWKNFMPECPEAYQNQARQIIGLEMQKQLENGRGVLYDGAEKTLEYLKKKGYTLVFLSNCGTSYMETSRRVFELDRYFSHYFCSAMFSQMPKSEILNHIKSTFESPMAMIGDRFHDIEAGHMNNMVTIGCTYGYGQASEFSASDYTIDAIEKLSSLLATIQINKG